MFNDGVSVSILANGEIVREQRGFVYLPFNTEYAILIKNFNNCRIALKVSIDGKDLFDTEYLSINAYSDIKLERFFKTNNKFLFIEKTPENSDPLIDSPPDGMIKIMFRKEKESQWERPIITWGNEYYNRHGWYGDKPLSPTVSPSIPKVPYKPYEITCQSNIDNECIPTWTDSTSTGSVTVALDSVDFTTGKYSSNYVQVMNMGDIRDGFTIKGRKSSQEFERVMAYPLEEETTEMSVMLKGYSFDNKEVKQIHYSRQKITCPVCGRKNKSFHKYCYNCGTALD